jgi:hypothetical protein
MDLQEDVNVETVFLIGDQSFSAFSTSTTILPETLYLEHDQPQHRALPCSNRPDDIPIGILLKASLSRFEDPISSLSWTN